MKGALDENGFAAVSGLASGPVKIHFGKEITAPIAATEFARAASEMPDTATSSITPSEAVIEAVHQLARDGQITDQEAVKKLKSAVNQRNTPNRAGINTAQKIIKTEKTYNG